MRLEWSPARCRCAERRLGLRLQQLLARRTLLPKRRSRLPVEVKHCDCLDPRQSRHANQRLLPVLHSCSPPPRPAQYPQHVATGPGIACGPTDKSRWTEGLRAYRVSSYGRPSVEPRPLQPRKKDAMHATALSRCGTSPTSPARFFRNLRCCYLDFSRRLLCHEIVPRTLLPHTRTPRRRRRLPCLACSSQYPSPIFPQRPLSTRPAMAGQSKVETLPPWGYAVAGAAGAVIANTLVYPLDLCVSLPLAHVPSYARHANPPPGSRRGYKSR